MITNLRLLSRKLNIILKPKKLCYISALYLAGERVGLGPITIGAIFGYLYMQFDSWKYVTCVWDKFQGNIWKWVKWYILALNEAIEPFLMTKLTFSALLVCIHSHRMYIKALRCQYQILGFSELQILGELKNVSIENLSESFLYSQLVSLLDVFFVIIEISPENSIIANFKRDNEIILLNNFYLNVN